MHMLMKRRTLLAVTVVALSLCGSAVARAATLFTLTGHGWGHGIGMSQYGALGYAQHGWTYDRILTHYYTGTTLGKVRSGTREKVLLIQSKPKIHLTLGSAGTTRDASGTRHALAPGSYRVEPGSSAGKVRVWSMSAARYVIRGADSPLTVSASSPLRLDDTSLNGYRGDHWWGSFVISRTGGSLMLVNDVGIDRYVRGVVPCEMPASWLPEALKTQAVAARSYARATRRSGAFDAYPDTRSQEYCPIESQTAGSDAAVTATARQIVLYHGTVATTFFSSSSGGRTWSISASWGGTDQPYLVPVIDRYDRAGGLNPNHTWSPRLYTPSGLTSALGMGHTVRSLDMTIDDPSQRVLSVVFHTRAGDTTMSASSVFSHLSLRSTYFRLLQETLVAPKRINAGESFNLVGRLWPVPKGTFTVEQKLGSEGVWTPINATITLNSQGQFSLARSPGQNVSYQIARRGVFSPVISVRVHASLTLSTSSGFSGHIRPTIAGELVSLQRQVAGQWSDVETAVIDGSGNYSFSTPVTSGSWRARYAGDGNHAPGSSATVVVP
jgi:stage II sporulation protein D